MDEDITYLKQGSGVKRWATNSGHEDGNEMLACDAQHLRHCLTLEGAEPDDSGYMNPGIFRLSTVALSHFVLHNRYWCTECS